MEYYKIAIPELKKTYTYKSHSPVKIGSFCSVIVKKREYIGVVVEVDNSPESGVNYLEIKKVFHEFPLIPMEFVDFLKTISHYYFVDYAVFFSIAFPPKMFKGFNYVYTLSNEKIGLFLTETETSVISALRDKAMTLKELKKMYGEGVLDAIDNLLKLGAIKREISDPFKRAEGVKRKALTLVRFPSKEEIEKMKEKSAAQYRVLDYLKRQKGINFFLVSELADILNVSYRVFDTLEKKGYVKCFYDYPSLIKENPSISKTIQLTDYQNSIVEEFKKNPEGVFYLFGVTGSGKTEVYLRCAEFTIDKGGRVLYLVPEIGLTPSAISRLKVRFGRDIAIIHSGLSYGERMSEWLRVMNNRVKIVVGTRSAVFAPLNNLGLIIVDEEHDHSYKQESFPRYNAVHGALFRAKISGIPVILGSATPSVESFYNAKTGKYRLFMLPERVGDSGLPEVKIVDMKKEFEISGGKKRVFSSQTIEEIKKSLEKKEQVLVFVNRRGFAPFLMCRKCGHIEMCPNCSVSLTVHSSPGSHPLQCHYCGYGKDIPDLCPECGDNFIQMMGYGTQRIEKRLKAEFPGANIVRVDRDTISTKNAFELFSKRMLRREIDIVVGTQMIAKGHHFPYLRLAVVVDADSLIAFPDFRSSERAFSLLLQVGGRAGRETPGKVLIQTYKPDHNIFMYLKNHDYLSFFEKEIEFRRKAGYPPFEKIIVIEIKGAQEESVSEVAALLGKKIREFNRNPKLKILGPVKASIYRIHNKYRYHIILKCAERKELRWLFLNSVYPMLRKKIQGIVIIPDIDPYSIM